MKNQKTLKVTINFRDKTSKSIEKNVMVGEKIDMNILHHSIMTIKKETNEILTTVVENEKRTPDWIFFILAGNKDNYKSLDEFEFGQNSPADFGVSCP